MTSDRNSLSRESWAAILLAVTTFATSWSAYQANLWTGTQTFKLAEAQNAETLKSQEVLVENQRRFADGLLVIAVVQALLADRNRDVEFYLTRLRGDLGEVIRHWLESDPLNNPNAPHNPLMSPEYYEKVIKEIVARQQSYDREFKTKMSEAREAGSNSDSYVLLTVLFSLVLFCAGIANTFQRPAIEGLLLVLATVFLVISLTMLFSYPVAAG